MKLVCIMPNLFIEVFGRTVERLPFPAECYAAGGFAGCLGALPATWPPDSGQTLIKRRLRHSNKSARCNGRILVGKQSTKDIITWNWAEHSARGRHLDLPKWLYPSDLPGGGATAPVG